ncbi:MAG: hypothetical protein MJ157_05050, partial [Clostridia bacterium]|nr:hypothetical protein [Clostridia bacterium]
GQPQKLFWPHIDWGQHLGQLKFGLQIDQELPIWLQDPEWSSRQHYQDNTLITHLKFKNQYAACWQDTLDIQSDLWRRSLHIKNQTLTDQSWRLLAYVAWQIDQSDLADGMYVEQNYLVQHKRKTYLGLRLTDYPLTAWGCGRQGTPSDPWLALQKGKIFGSKDNIKGGAAALSWDLGLCPAGQSLELELLVAAAPDPIQLDSLFLAAKSRDMQSQSQAFWQGWAKPEPTWPLYRRSLLTLKLLTDAESGGSLAAPEFDPAYEYSGGYGYCWPRDGFFVALAFDEAGYAQEAAAFYEFARRVQCPDGDWQQRYWLDGSWASHWGRQTDQTGAVLWGYYRHYQLTQDREFLKESWLSVRQGAEFLLRQLSPENHLPQAAIDLWEDSLEQNTYTAAAVWGGLQGAVGLAKALGEANQARRWQMAGEQLKQAILQYLPNEQGVFTRARGNPILDSAVLGLVYPFAVLEPQHPLALKTRQALEEHLLNAQTGGLHRYQWDQYAGGNPWVVSTLWLALVHIRQGNREQAAELIRWSEKHASPTGLLPEQIDQVAGRPYWVLPLAWSHALYILACLEYKKRFQP